MTSDNATFENSTFEVTAGSSALISASSIVKGDVTFTITFTCNAEE